MYVCMREIGEETWIEIYGVCERETQVDRLKVCVWGEVVLKAGHTSASWAGLFWPVD